MRSDVRREEDVRNLIDKTVEGVGRLDVAVNNAGTITSPKRLPAFNLVEVSVRHCCLLAIFAVFIATIWRANATICVRMPEVDVSGSPDS